MTSGKRTIGILTGGGYVPGQSPAIRAIPGRTPFIIETSDV